MNGIDRNRIIEKLKERLEPLEYIYALWLEGADATGMVDEYSDIDFWVDFEDEYEEEAIKAVESALEEIAKIDYKHIVKHGHPKIRQRIYHLSGSSEYLMIDFCWQLHSRAGNECEYIKGNTVEAAKVIFDKAEVVRFVDGNPANYMEASKARLEECKYRYSQHSRVKKYIRRGLYLEAYAYYNRYVLEPLIDLLRLMYTPVNADYYLIHISHHIPEDKRKRLEYFAQINSLDAMEKRIPEAEDWFNEMVKELERKHQ
ncbi:nucleotidyltransferase domain-containing protein [Pseudoclostridium thermosuccinogenes]|uniref:nucleotidyltransferase domain-containing protein n=1 Tax=Clostridium thermosuccinogenes TaxID=84032 RepID=UPI000CCC37A3|nr:nucleotidyltransferase domain-containing protein [Pseudoclostridium thermosuccinogenes]PNT90607.1 hypothetical protein CDQ83_18340 [Pseudoclostridium thermosuccinogenes]